MPSRRNRLHALSTILLTAGSASVAGAQNCDLADIFPQPPSYDLGSNPSDLIVADFNGDGAPDLATSNRNSDDVSVLLNNGDGTFASQTTYPCGDTPSSVAAGDFDGDGDADLVVTNYDDSDISVLFGNGDGTFAPETQISTLMFPSDIASGDFDGDGFDDLVVTIHNEQLFSVFLSNGDGTFADPVNYVVDAFPFGSVGTVQVADLNADGSLDIFVSHNSGVETGSVRSFYGDGNGAFEAGPSIVTPTGPGDFAIGDLDADGDLDFAIPHGSPLGLIYEETLTIAINDGGAFTTTSGKAEGPGQVTIADIDADGVNDVFAANGSPFSGPNGSYAIFYAGEGDGSIDAPIGFDLMGPTTRVAAADVNSDGIIDCLAISGNAVFVMHGRTGNRLPDVPLLYTSTSNDDPSTEDLALGDFNNDGALDIVFGGWSSLDGIHLGGLLLSNGGEHLSFAGQTGGRAVAAGDLNNDGNLDRVASKAFGNGIDTLLGNGDGSFTSIPGPSTSTLVVELVLADFDSDGNLDAAAHGSNQQSILTYFGTGDGNLSAGPVLMTSATLLSLASADLNNDGHDDLVASVSTAAAQVYLANPKGGFEPAIDIALGSNASDIALGFVNGDEWLDLVYAGQQEVAALMGSGDGSFGAPVSTSVEGDPTSIATGDLNDDGYADLALARAVPGRVSISLGDGTGAFAAPLAMAPLPSSGGTDIKIADMDGNGSLDIVYCAQYNSTVGVHLNACTPTPSCPGDVTGDGETDLADLNLVLANFGQTTSDGDTNNDGVVDLADLNTVLANFGTGCD
ncbi:MAG: FG-GAP-like repeat-containing protein [Phycisphaerales bacterium JB065]